MSFPRQRSVVSLYREKGEQYVLVLNANGINNGGSYDCVANVRHVDYPCLAPVCCGRDYLRTLRRIEWSELPEDWQVAFTRYLNDPPESTVGLHRIPKRP